MAVTAPSSNTEALAIFILWIPPVGTVDFFNIRIRETDDISGEYTFVDQVAGNENQYTIQDLFPSTSYNIRVTVQCGTTESTRTESVYREITTSTSKTLLDLIKLTLCSEIIAWYESTPIVSVHISMGGHFILVI